MNGAKRLHDMLYKLHSVSFSFISCLYRKNASSILVSLNIYFIHLLLHVFLERDYVREESTFTYIRVTYCYFRQTLGNLLAYTDNTCRIHVDEVLKMLFDYAKMLGLR